MTLAQSDFLCFVRHCYDYGILTAPPTKRRRYIGLAASGAPCPPGRGRPRSITATVSVCEARVTTLKNKPRALVYLNSDVIPAFSGYAARREQSMSLIAEAAIAKRFDQKDCRLAHPERDLGVGVETLAPLIRFWLNTTTLLLEPAAKAARAQAGACYDNFAATPGRRLNEGSKLQQEVP